MFLLVPAYPGCPGSKAVKQSLLLLYCSTLTLLVGWQKGHPACRKLSGVVLPWLSVWRRCRLAYGPADANATLSLALVKCHKGTEMV